MPLKPQDVVVILAIAVHRGEHWSFSSLALRLGMSPSEVHAAVGRAAQAGLLGPDRRRPNTTGLLEFLVHGLKYAFAVERGGVTRGMPTAYAASPLVSEVHAGDDLPPVWPDPEGAVRGEAWKPLYRCVPTAARNDAKLYQCLALVDAIRGGRARERTLAEKHLQSLLTP